MLRLSASKRQVAPGTNKVICWAPVLESFDVKAEGNKDAMRLCTTALCESD